jgi:hypothetical protein
MPGYTNISIMPQCLVDQEIEKIPMFSKGKDLITLLDWLVWHFNCVLGTAKAADHYLIHRNL